MKAFLKPFIFLAFCLMMTGCNNTLQFTPRVPTAPTASIISPSNNATNVSLNPNIQLQFSEPVNNVNSTNVTLHSGSATGTLVAIGNIVAGPNNTYTFSPSAGLTSNTPYYVVLGNGITDNAGNALAATNFSFTTGIGWQVVGTPRFSGEVNYVSLALASDGTPYVAYEDATNGYKATVMKFNGTAWVAVGTPGFSAGQAEPISFALASDGTPYVAYSDGANSYKATVMKFNGTAWVTVGTPGFSAGRVDSMSLALASDGTPYVAYEDATNNDKATVMKFNGTLWVDVGTPGFSADVANEMSLVLASDGTPYLAYEDVGSSNKVTVMKFN